MPGKKPGPTQPTTSASTPGAASPGTPVPRPAANSAANPAIRPGAVLAEPKPAVTVGAFQTVAGPTGTPNGPLDSSLDALDRMFLTPRVLDQRAFTEFASTLRDLLREAADTGESIRAGAGSAGQLKAEIAAMTAELRAKVEAAAKLMPALQDRVTRAQQFLDLATDDAKLMGRAQEVLEGVIRSRLAEAEKRAGELIDRVVARAAQVEAETATRLRTMEDDAHTRLVQAEDRHRRASAELRERLEQVARQTEQAEERSRLAHERTASALDEIASRMDRAERALEERLAAAEQRAALLLKGLEERLEPMQELASGVIRDLEVRLAGAGQTARTLEQAQAAAARLPEMLRAVETLTRDGSALGQWKQVIGSLERARDEAIAALRQTAAGIEQADASRTGLAQVVDGAAHHIDLLHAELATLTERTETMRQSIQHAIMAAETARDEARAQLAPETLAADVVRAAQEALVAQAGPAIAESALADVKVRAAADVESRVTGPAGQKLAAQVAQQLVQQAQAQAAQQVTAQVSAQMQQMKGYAEQLAQWLGSAIQQAREQHEQLLRSIHEARLARAGDRIRPKMDGTP